MRTHTQRVNFQVENYWGTSRPEIFIGLFLGVVVLSIISLLVYHSGAQSESVRDGFQEYESLSVSVFGTVDPALEGHP